MINQLKNGPIKEAISNDPSNSSPSAAHCGASRMPGRGVLAWALGEELQELHFLSCLEAGKTAQFCYMMIDAEAE